MRILLATTVLCFVVLAIVSCSSAKAMQKAASEPTWKVISNGALVSDVVLDTISDTAIIKGDIIVPRGSENAHMDIQVEEPPEILYRTSTGLTFRSVDSRGAFGGRGRKYIAKLPGGVTHAMTVKVYFHDTGRSNDWEKCRQPITD